jgi:predicted nucleic acid-binding protein
VLIEVIWVLDSVFGVPLVLQEPEVVGAALERFRRRPRLGFSDCLVLGSARKAGHVPLATFDKELGKLDDVERL